MTRPQCSPMEFGMTFGKGRGEARDTPPFRILLLADFGSGARPPLASRQAHGADIDSLDDVLRHLAPRADCTIAGASALVPFASLDDFHPDSLFKRLGAFASWRELRARLANPATAAGAEGEARALLGLQVSGAAGSGASPSASPPQEGDVMSQLLSGSAKPKPQGFDADAFIRSIVGGGSSSPKPAAGVLSALDDRLSALMRDILHAPAVQRAEGAARSLHTLITGLNLDENLTLSVLDVSRDELIADMLSAPDPRGTALGKLIAGEARLGDASARWSLIISLEAFGPSDAGLLSRLAQVAQAADAPLIAGGQPALVRAGALRGRADVDDWTLRLEPAAVQAWNTLRAAPEAAWLALALPRVLLRQPYGPGTDPIDSFSFAEIADLASPRADDVLLWGGGALAPALVLGNAFSENEWDLDISLGGEVSGLPVVSYQVGGKPEAKPCAEAWLADRAIERITGEGLIAVASVRGRDAARVSPPQSLAGGSLRAWWA